MVGQFGVDGTDAPQHVPDPGGDGLAGALVLGYATPPDSAFATAVNLVCGVLS